MHSNAFFVTPRSGIAVSRLLLAVKGNESHIPVHGCRYFAELHFAFPSLLPTASLYHIGYTDGRTNVASMALATRRPFSIDSLWLFTPLEVSTVTYLTQSAANIPEMRTAKHSRGSLPRVAVLCPITRADDFCTLLRVLSRCTDRPAFTRWWIFRRVGCIIGIWRHVGG